MSEQLLDLLKLGLLALLYLFFLRVMWAVWTELRTPAVEPRPPTRSSRTSSAAATRHKRNTQRGGRVKVLRVTEPADLAGTEYPLAAEMTLGRSPGCTVVVDDTYVSQIHARVFAQDDQFQIEDLGSTNGTLHNGDVVQTPEPLKAGDTIQVGNLVLQVR